MKKKIILILVALYILSCKDSSENGNKKPLVEDNSKNVVKEENQFVADENLSLNNWNYHYKSKDADFELTKFKFDEKYSVETSTGSVSGSFDEEFDENYQPFLIYNSTKEMYIDLDSYNMTLQGDEVYFEPDQEINVVNIPAKTVTRIGFYGPSYWVEDAYWKNDHTVVLLENNDDKVPMIVEIDLNSQEATRYVYSDTLKDNSDYSKLRIQKIRENK